MKKSKSLEGRSPEVQEIIGQVPHWLIRWGLTAILSVLIILVFIAWFIKYPDIANVSVEILETHDMGSIYQLIARGLADERYFRDIQVGQAVKINLAAYPFQDYGAVKGNVVLRSELNGKGQFIVTIALPNGLTTTHHKNLSYIPQMTGNAQIILRESKLINRIFGRFAMNK